MNKYIVVEPGGDITKLMLSDLEKEADVTILYQPNLFKPGILRSIWSHHIGYTLNKKKSVPLQRIWWSQYTLNSLKFKREDEYYIIFGNAVLNDLDDGFLRHLTKMPNVHLILYFSDPVDSEFAKLAKVRAQRNKYEYIFTFDPKDSETYGYIQTRFLYSISSVEPDHDAKSDICFIGENKGRLNIAEAIYRECDNRGIKCNFRITRVPEEHRKLSGIAYNSRISYLKTVSQAKAANCLLEILQKGQSGVTFRYYEAICYNKKLLTNNKEVYSLPYYDSRYIRVFDDVESIDFDWIREPIDIEYGYRGDFSPKKFLQQIKQLVEEK